MVVLIAVCDTKMRLAESFLVACERCSSGAEIPFDWLLDEVTGHSGSDVDYILTGSVTCPQCLGDITEKTLVQW